jgi:lipoate-protein ligase A
MINKIKLYESNSFDPYLNLATEQYLMETVEEDACILFLWQNQNTVVIGKNQNAWKECRTALLSEEGGFLARRLSGGGAVFHDLGNLNFTFLLPQSEYDLDRQFSVIAEAVSLLGLKGERSGRNDVLAEGRKFSGNAFYKNGRQAYHHGTLLIDVDMNKLGRYLNPSKAKLQAKGVDSVRSRVVNLKELSPAVTIESMKDAMSVCAINEQLAC